MKRIDALREEALFAKCCKDEFYYRFYKNYCNNAGNDDFSRYADAFYEALSCLSVSISEGELIVGKICGELVGDEREEYEEKIRGVACESCSVAGGGQDSHMAIDYELLLSRGIVGIIGDIDNYLTACEPEKVPFYKAAKKCLLAVIEHSRAYAEKALSLAESAGTERREELLEIARICRKVPAYPAESFHEALQSVSFVSYCLSYNPLRFCHQQFQLGHPDRYLFEIYERDIGCGVITKECARELIACFALQINNRVPSGLSCGYMVGGRNENGEAVANELTELFMQVIDDVRLVYPAVAYAYTDGAPQKYLNCALQILSRGRSHPAIFNDDVITEGLRLYGVPEDESHSYIHSTCVEITPVASSNVWVASPYMNLAQVILEVMEGEYSDFDALLCAVLANIDARIEKDFVYHNEQRKIRRDNSMNPLLSCFVNDCLKRGLDIERGGARYNWIMPSFVGMANLVDSLYAIKTVVYDERELSLCQLKKAVDENFEDNERLQRHLSDDIAKYGNDVDEVDVLFSLISSHIVEECKKYTPIHSGARLVPSVFCWQKHEVFGRQTGATPDGRRAHFPLGDGSGPAQGRERCGPTASILSSTKWDHKSMIGGVAVNIKLSRNALGKDSIDNMAALVRAYMMRGGFEMQINVVDKSTLAAARENPEAYRDLLVRIGGYSDYFVRLSPEMQEELMLRTEHIV